MASVKKYISPSLDVKRGDFFYKNSPKVTTLKLCVDRLVEKISDTLKKYKKVRTLLGRVKKSN